MIGTRGTRVPLPAGNASRTLSLTPLLHPQADKYGLPRVLVFSNSATKPVIKAMTTEYRRRLLVAEIRKNRKNKVLLERYNVRGMRPHSSTFRMRIHARFHSFEYVGAEISHHVGFCC